MKRVIAVALILLLAVLGGCTPIFVLPDETVRAPITTGEYEAIQKALVESVGEDIALKYPKCNGTSAAFTTGDVDGDGESEVLAFYQPASALSTHINILKKNEGKWTSIADIEPIGSALNRVEMSDLDKDGKLEVITGWSVYDSKNYELAIFSLKDKGITQRTREKYTDFILSDFDKDNTLELVLLLLDSAEKESSIYLYKLTEQEFLLKSSEHFDTTVAYYSGIYESKDKDSVSYYVDGYMGNGAMITEGVRYSEKGIEKLIDNTLDKENSYRGVEIPLKKEGEKILIPFAAELNTAEKMFPVEWKYFDGEKLKTEYISLVCLDGAYEIQIEKDWQSRITASYIYEQKCCVFYEYKGENSAAQEVFRVLQVAVSNDGKDVENPEQYADLVKIKTTDTSVFFVSVIEDNALNITTETIRQSFLIREN